MCSFDADPIHISLLRSTSDLLISRSIDHAPNRAKKREPDTGSNAAPLPGTMILPRQCIFSLLPIRETRDQLRT